MTLYELGSQGKGIKFGRLKEMCDNLIQGFRISQSENDGCKEYITNTKVTQPIKNNEYLAAMHKIQLIDII